MVIPNRSIALFQVRSIQVRSIQVRSIQVRSIQVRVVLVAMAVYDGQAALELIETFAPDVVLLDIGLPDIDGYELATRLRQRPNARHARLVAVTGWGQGVDHARSRDHGFVAHLTKPVDAAVVLEIIGAVPPRGDKSYRA